MIIKRMRMFVILLLIVPVMMFLGVPAFAQTDAPPTLKGLSGGLALPIEIQDLNAVGMDIYLGFDYAKPLSDTFALGFYLTAGGGFMGAIHPYSKYDRFYYPFKFSAGLLMEIGELRNHPFIFGVGPCTGIGFVDMDLILPWEFRIGLFVSDHWYVMAELTYGVSLAHETVYIEPSIRVGYNFGR